MVKENAKLIGSEVFVRFDGMWFLCQILDVREVYGVVQCQVTPSCTGSGSAWKNKDSLFGAIPVETKRG